MRFETIFGRSGLSCKFRYPCLWCVVCDALTPLSVFFLQVWKCTLGTLVKLYVTFPSDAAHRRWIISFHISQLIPTSGWERTLLSFQMSENQLEVLFLRREMALKIWSNVSEVTGLQRHKNLKLCRWRLFTRKNFPDEARGSTLPRHVKKTRKPLSRHIKSV